MYVIIRRVCHIIMDQMYTLVTIFTYLGIMVITVARSDVGERIARPGCRTHCGNVSIPFPFGIGRNCYANNWFEVECTAANPALILKRTKLEVLNISVNQGTIQTKSPISFFNCQHKESRNNKPVLNNLYGSPFGFSGDNIFIAVSCGVEAIIDADSDNSIIQVGCKSTCSNSNILIESCDGLDCCKATVPIYLGPSFRIVFRPNDSSNHDDCKYAFLVDENWLAENQSKDLGKFRNMDSVPVILDWIMDYSLDDKMLSSSSESVVCNNITMVDQSIKYQCTCNSGFRGNPYLPRGCQDINECKENPMVCSDDLTDTICINNYGSYTCGKKSRKNINKFIIGIVSGLGALFLFFTTWYFYKTLKKHNDAKHVKKIFKRNGGMLLEQEISAGKVNVEKIKVFNSKELENATDHFNINRVLGKGGQGTVYKGMLADGKIIAVKKSTKVDEAKVTEFINEVVILSQINHRNIVKLLGCCLETEVPLLVYEFIPNGTLSYYIHNYSEEFKLNWKMRLRIAIEVVEALSYLHSAASFPIYHRDIKSTNILLDEKFRAKIADFGTSRLITLEQTHLTTVVYGTAGYLDPEYLQSNQYTVKSDVYSLGVVLVELLTGQKAISLIRTEEGRSLATYFLISMRENRLLDILDAQVLEGPLEEIMIFANLAKCCLDLHGNNRPTMKEVVMKLEVIKIMDRNT
ncbi:wall-associated receptor kinase-like 1 [Cannabis sativa]|uniref:wall-associated receptor kinase-like 1 n=1 Tax=Cannabis sativa TaxID=3483 RepID=UPI0029CA2B51|nr:wall-associated receptor kinase-like 1 [Cannabis sativa]